MQTALFAAHNSLEQHHWWFRGRREVITSLGALLLPRGGAILDVGCGTGADIAAFASQFSRRGIDPSSEAIAFAAQAYPDVSFTVGYAPGDCADELGRADLVLLCDVLEHIEHDEAFIAELVAGMKPGAHLLLTVPADPRLWSPHDEVYGHYRRYSRSTLHAVLARTPARVRLLAPMNRRLFPLARAVRATTALFGRGLGRSESDLVLPWAPLNRLLMRILAGEAPRIARALQSGSGSIPGHGVSLLAVIQRVATPGA